MVPTVPALSNSGIFLPPTKASLAKALAAATNGATAKATATTTTGTNAASATTDLGTTFLNLLSTELQNQDPTAPVDSTAMVGQMISLNQLDQLIAINQTLGGTTSTSATAGISGSSASASTSVAPTAAAKAATADPVAAALAAAQAALPFDPNTLMPIATTSKTTTNNILGAK